MGFGDFFSKRTGAGGGARFGGRNNDAEFDSDSSRDLLTREELFELPARELRRKCKKLGLDTSKIFEKKALVNVLLDFESR